MEITYRLAEDDVVAFAERYAATSPTVRRARWRNVVISVIASAALGACFWDATKDAGLGITIAVTGLIGGLLYPLVLKDQTRKATIRLYREGKNLAHAKPITLRAVPEALFSESAGGSSTILWECLERIDQTADHLFLYTSSLNAVIVPKAGVIAGDFESFADAVTRLRRDAGPAANPDDPAPV
jgi:YcxB-like protein